MVARRPTRAKQLLFVQGAGEGAHAEDARLAESLRAHLGPSYQVLFPAMPNEAEADYQAWKRIIERETRKIGKDAILVGHSLGASVLIAMYTQKAPKAPMAGLFLVASPFWYDDAFWRSEELELRPDAANNYPRDVPLFLYHGVDDEFVPVAHVDMYAKALPQAVVQRLPRRNHQLNDDMTEVARDIKRLG